MKRITSNTGRIIYAVLFATFGINQFINAHDFVHYVPSFIPGGILWVYLISVFLIAASISIILKKYTKTTCLLLSLFLIVIVFTVHIPGLFNPDMMKISMINLLKDTGLAGGGLILAGIFGISEAE